MVSIILILMYLLVVFFDIIAIILFLDWFFHLLSNARWNFLRKLLFRWANPFLIIGGEITSFKVGAFDSRGIFISIILILFDHLGFPWIVLFCYSFRG